MDDVLRALWYKLSSGQRFLLRRIFYSPLDLWDIITFKTNKYVPPRGHIYTGSPSSAKDFLRQGAHQLEILKETISIMPHDQVLDIGSGVGRTAVALTKYLQSSGRYEGFDAVKKGVEWCTSRITKDYPNFNFQYIPIYNDLYNNQGIKATDLVFPYDDDSFDKVISFSLFTHMQIDEIEHYFGEINRVLKVKGMAMSTFFTFNDMIEDYIANRPDFKFGVSRDGYRLMNESVKSGNISVHINKLESMLDNNGLRLVKLFDGFWKREKNNNAIDEFQDIVVFERK